MSREVNGNEVVVREIDLFVDYFAFLALSLEESA